MTHETTTPAAQPAGESMILTCQVKTEFTIEVPIHNGMSKAEAHASAVETVRSRLKEIGADVVSSWRQDRHPNSVEQLELRMAGARFPTYRKAWFSFDDAEKPEDYFVGWTNGERWNGWGMPYFEKAEAERVLAWHNARLEPADQPKAYLNGDRYFFPSIDDTPGDPPHPGYDPQQISVETADAIDYFGTYAIGAGSWCWNVAYDDPTNGPEVVR